MKENTCILLFSRSAASESEKKQLLSDIGANAQLHDVLYHRAVNTVSKSGLPVLRIDEHQQVGNTFGERFYNAISSAFDRGYDSVIAVGSDCPSLRTADIHHAHQELQAGRSCLGPSIDGGVYLLAISKQFFNASFKHLPWRTGVLADRLSDFLVGLDSQLTFLGEKIDLDFKKQLNTMACFLKRQLGIGIPFQSSMSLIHHASIFNDRLYDVSHSRRGPPSLRHAA